ncbi:septum formation initiator family protein [Strepomyces sp. STD 3.1]|nr:septum formation initiator family protein [Streptomyces sp. STD 3.1]
MNVGVRKSKNVTSLPSSHVETQQKQLDSKSRRRVGLIRRLTVFGIFALILSIFITVKLFSQQSAIEEKKAEHKQLTEELTKLEKKEKSLNTEIKQLNDDDYIKKLAGKDYFLTEDGQIIFNVKD